MTFLSSWIFFIIDPLLLLSYSPFWSLPVLYIWVHSGIVKYKDCMYLMMTCCCEYECHVILSMYVCEIMSLQQNTYWGWWKWLRLYMYFDPEPTLPKLMIVFLSAILSNRKYHWNEIRELTFHLFHYFWSGILQRNYYGWLWQIKHQMITDRPLETKNLRTTFSCKSCNVCGDLSIKELKTQPHSCASEKRGFTKVSRIQPLETRNFCIKFHGNPFNLYWDIPDRATLLAWQRKRKPSMKCKYIT